MRLFIAIDLPEEVVSSLGRLIVQLQSAARIHWCTPESLHITTKFVGNWPDEQLDRLTGALGSLAPREPIPIDVRGLGFFPNPHNPRVFWAAVHAGPGLADLARETEAALERIGIAPEKRPFSPHLTLARVKEPVPLQALRQAIAALPSVEFGSFTADRFYLYQSTLRPTGSVYTKLSAYPFSR
jgi:RNA 2',3'-cyclic 3'-phosphodiesterase